jgi:hypothetical protein
MDTPVLAGSIAVLLNLVDICVAAGLALGGWNMTNSHPVTGFVAVLFAPFLLYLSVALWLKRRKAMIIRIVLYGVAFLVSGVSFSILVFKHAISIDQRFLVFGATLLVIILVSALHVWLAFRKSSGAERSYF